MKGCQIGESLRAISGLEIAPVEMGREGFAQACGVQRGQNRQAAKPLHPAHFRNRAFRIRHRIADEDDAYHFDGAVLERFQGQERVVDSAKRGARDQDDGRAPADEQRDLEAYPA